MRDILRDGFSLPALTRQTVFFAFTTLVALGVFATPQATRWEELPRDVTRHVDLVASLASNRIQTTLDGQSSGEVLIDLQFTLQPKWHLYQSEVKIFGLSDPQLQNLSWEVKTIQEPEPSLFLDPVTKSVKPGYKDVVVFQVAAKLPREVENLSIHHKVPLAVGFQACSDKICLLPVIARFDVGIQKHFGSERKEPSWWQRQLATFRAQLAGDSASGLVWLVLAFAGILTAFTPCVYPLYPITLGMFSRWAGSSKTVGLFALSYSLGLSLSFSILGWIAARSGLVFGSITQNPLFLATLGIVLALSALAFSGWISFSLPSSWLQRLGSAQGDSNQPKAAWKSCIEAAAMGAGLGVVASPCVGPALVAVLAWIAANPATAALRGWLFLFWFGLWLSAPLLVLAGLAQRGLSLPRLSGRWSAVAKHAGSALMLAGAVFYLNQAYGIFVSSRAKEHQSLTKHFPIQSYPDWLQQTSTQNPTTNKWTIMDFRADWCAACIELEQDTFSHPDVAKEISDNWNFVQVDFTTMTEENNAIAKRHQVLSLPTVLVFPGNSTVPCSEMSLHEFEAPNEFLKRLENAKTNCK